MPRTKRDPRYNPKLRRDAAKALKKHGTYRAAAEAMGLSVGRVHKLVAEHNELTKGPA